MAHNPFVIIPAARPFPCETCKSECCSGVPLLDDEWKTILQYLRKVPRKYLKRLAAQKREPLKCLFVDTEKWQCGVYPGRPHVCQMFGRTPEMECSYAPERSTEVSPAECAILKTRFKKEDAVWMTAFNPVARLLGMERVPIMTWKDIFRLL